MLIQITRNMTVLSFTESVLAVNYRAIYRAPRNKNNRQQTNINCQNAEKNFCALYTLKYDKL